MIDPALFDRYGFSRSSWVFCWKCRQAIALEQLATTAVFSDENGWAHASCPPPGTAPRMPAALERARVETPRTDPAPRRWWNDDHDD
jgi:hypothetical protein